MLVNIRPGANMHSQLKIYSKHMYASNHPLSEIHAFLIQNVFFLNFLWSNALITLSYHQNCINEDEMKSYYAPLWDNYGKYPGPGIQNSRYGRLERFEVVNDLYSSLIHSPSTHCVEGLCLIQVT